MRAKMSWYNQPRYHGLHVGAGKPFAWRKLSKDQASSFEYVCSLDDLAVFVISHRTRNEVDSAFLIVSMRVRGWPRE